MFKPILQVTLYNIINSIKDLFGHYNITMTDRELEANSLKNKINSIELISDFDFVLPMITQLNFYTNFSAEQQKEKQENNEERPGRLYVYEYSHITSFNYLLDHLKTYHIGYDQALVKLNYSVVPHFSELDFVFGLPLLSMSGLLKGQSRDGKYLYNYTKDEVEFSLLMIDYWTNFAKYGLDIYYIKLIFYSNWQIDIFIIYIMQKRLEET